MKTKRPKIVFMGTPEFAVASLKAMHESGIEIGAVVTAPDKPAGRGKKLTSPAVKNYAEANLPCPVFQPEKLKDPAFIEELKAIEADIFVVVAFRMLPEAVWGIPPLGTINLHASLLPNYRGAAPINWAIINGEKESGVTTFVINHEIDTGRILLQEKVAIHSDDDAGDLHDRLMDTGSELLVRTVKAMYNGEIESVDQEQLTSTVTGLKSAPKIFREDCRIDWNRDAVAIFNLIRGLSPFPAAFSMLDCNGEEEQPVKIFKVKPYADGPDLLPGSIRSDHQSYIRVGTGNGTIEILELQAPGKKRMAVPEFLRGYKSDLNNARFN